MSNPEKGQRPIPGFLRRAVKEEDKKEDSSKDAPELAEEKGSELSRSEIKPTSRGDGDGDKNATLKMNHPIFSFFRRGSTDKMSFEELQKKMEKGELDSIMEGPDGNRRASDISHMTNMTESTNGGVLQQQRDNGHEQKISHEPAVEIINEPEIDVPFVLTEIVLKFTTLSEGNETPAFLVDTSGASIGRGPANEVAVPTDTTLEADKHAMIVYKHDRKAFYLKDMGLEHGAAVRIEAGTGLRQWRLSENALFSAGNSSFKVVESDDTGVLIEVGAGPLKGERRRVTQKGASLGRATDNVLSIGDRELSRRHSRIEYEAEDGKFYLCDLNSTNGTYMHLVGPYEGLWRLSLNDHILVGRTGLSINRYDYGVSEEMGKRPSMEDAHVLIQDLDVTTLTCGRLGPAFFAGVFDGHGGSNTSNYLSQHLHNTLAHHLAAEADTLVKAYKKDSGAYGGSKEKTRNNSFVYDITEGLLSTFGLGSSAAAAPADEGYGRIPLPPPVPRPHVTPAGTSQGCCNFRLGGDLDRRVSHVLLKAFEETDAAISQKEEEGTSMAGSTATTALILRDRLWLANVGDSRTLLCRKGEVYAFTLDHKPDREDEIARIKAAGGFVIHHRVLGELAVSRAFGDAEYKKGIQEYVAQDDLKNLRQGTLMGGGDEEADLSRPILTAEPEIQSLRLTPDDEFLLLACDGLFDVFDNEEVVEVVREEMREHQDAQRCVEKLSHRAIHERNCRDNVTIVLIILKPSFWED